MDFTNKCIVNMFCREKCEFKQYCEENKVFENEECNVCKFIKWLTENDKSLGYLVKLKCL